ncbi:SLATT domain-containing protein [Planococcus lenghuensis]|uniref:SMODS and SLOG-associating 2TM effector domain-containing protein n=1 Tax=Planococcus lenghuensis TaxID=2213202 RepID=A0A1Q2KWQ1_9BACL|nr:SLATT domain-containing protein [Planococcus lenghuensis]AQQ52237.1 hypothetical protein B0X71_03335 [Planococcus lenghuensis]
MKEIKKYQDRDINDEIEKKINTLNKTRDNRLEMSKRLTSYDDKWKVVFFFLNIEAVIFILLALSETNIDEILPGEIFSLFSGIFSIYVILLQYYINSLNYRERALRMHYHQLDIEDLILKFKVVFLKKKDPENSIEYSEAIKDYKTIMFKYQSILKNNENHSPIDNKVNEFYRSNIDSQKANKDCKLFRKWKPLDLTVDNTILYLNVFFTFGLLVILVGVLWVIS